LLGFIGFRFPCLRYRGSSGLTGLLFFRTEDATVEIAVSEGEVRAIIGWQKNAELACDEIGGVIGAEFADKDVFREERTARLNGDEGKDGGNEERQERDGAFHGWILCAGLNWLMRGRS